MEDTTNLALGITMLILCIMAIVTNSFHIWAYQHYQKDDFSRRMVAAIGSGCLCCTFVLIPVISVWTFKPSILLTQPIICTMAILTIAFAVVTTSTFLMVFSVWRMLKIKWPLRIGQWASSPALLWSYAAVGIFNCAYVFVIALPVILVNQSTTVTCSIHNIPRPLLIFTLYVIILPPAFGKIFQNIYVCCIANRYSRVTQQDDDTPLAYMQLYKQWKFICIFIFELLFCLCQIITWCLVVHCPGCLADTTFIEIQGITMGVLLNYYFVMCLIIKHFRQPLIRAAQQICQTFHDGIV